MKNIIFSLVLLSSLPYKGQVVQSSCIAHDSVYWRYRDDADKMAVRRAFHVNDNNIDSININKQVRDRYLQALIAVYNATALPARDSVVSAFNVHIFGNNVNQVSIRADSNLQWIKNIKAHIIPCGETKMDFLMNKYHLKDVQHYPSFLNSTTDIILEADSNINTQPLADTLKTISGIFISSGGIYGSIDGNMIEDSVTTSDIWLVYSVGWDDGMPIGYPCPSGCLYRKFWQFKVYNDCSVEYGGSFGAPLTVGIKENKLDPNNVKVYPNPFNEKITFEIPYQVNLRLKIIDAIGQEVIIQELINANTSISTNNLQRGIYYYILSSGEEFLKTGKLVKP